MKVESVELTEADKISSHTNYMNGWGAGTSVLECPEIANKDWVKGWSDGRVARRIVAKKIAIKMGIDVRTVTIR